MDVIEDLTLSALLPLSESSMNEEGRLCNIAIQKALEDINAFPNLLVGYNLTSDYFDLKVI
ncbi:hypothetical protein DPMN_143744 [Dreissena polymorpha]|uniref:Uncharacterized protein n=1 Tax=Dreissena polymorpha TaxID=45954 RepID=A0A9D4GDD8_DREPO|nr:hypothetical protein DPMN_143744 [Dreissena polymorpha]